VIYMEQLHEPKHKAMNLNLINLSQEDSDIYTGTESIKFNNRHPIFKALMKLEFEDIIRNYHKRISRR